MTTDNAHSPLPRSQMRVSDHDRELVATVLQTGYAEGRITRDELDERLSSAMAAKTFEDLAPITADLTPRSRQDQYRSPAAVAPRTSEGIVQTAGASTVADNDFVVMGSKKRVHALRLRKKTNATAIMGDIVYDLRDGGVMESMDCELAITIIMGDVKLYVPEGVAVIDKVSNIMGDSKIKGVGPVPPDSPTITLTGMCMMGDVTVIGPHHESWTKKLGFGKAK